MGTVLAEGETVRGSDHSEVRLLVNTPEDQEWD